MPDPMGQGLGAPNNGSAGAGAPTSAPPGIGGGPAVPAASPPPSAPTTPSVPASTGGAAAGGSSGQSLPQTSPMSPAGGFVGVLDALRSAGVDLGQGVTNDHQALQTLLAAHRQNAANRQLVDLGQRYMQHAPQFQAWLQQQAEEQRQKQSQQQQGWWKAPEWDQSWEGKLYRDPQTGELKVLPGQDPSILHKYNAGRDHSMQFLTKFAFDPIGAIKPGLEEVARSVAQEMIQQHLGNYTERNFATSVVQQNSEWLHARDQAGNVLHDPQTGKPQLSHAGQRMANYVGLLERAGIRDVQVQWQLAQRMVYGDLAMQQAGQTQQTRQAQDQGEAAKQAYLAQAAAAQQGGTGTPPGNFGTPAAQPGNQPPMRNPNDLMRVMMAEMSAAGFKAEDRLT